MRRAELSTTEQDAASGSPQVSKSLPHGVPDAHDPKGVALALLLASARREPTDQAVKSIRWLIQQGVDWNAFAQKATDHDVAALCGHTLARVAADLVPAEIGDALQVVIDETRIANQRLFDTLGRLLDALAAKGVEAIPLKGPALAIQLFGDVGLRKFRDLDFLVREGDLRTAIVALNELGYERRGSFTEAQFEMIHRLQGQEIIFHRSGGTAVEPHTRLIPLTLALDVDHTGIWRRARPANLNGRSFLALEPEDELITLAIHGGKELWWNIKWACDIAAFIHLHPYLDWNVIELRARAQGCLRMVLLAASLARRHLGAIIPENVAASVAVDPVLAAMLKRIVEHWQSDGVTGPPSNRVLSLDRLRLHDGLSRKASYIMRTWFLPKPHHVGLVRLPAWLGLGYVPVKLVHDVIALPLYRLCEGIGLKSKRAGRNAALEPTDPSDAEGWARRAQKFLDSNRLTQAIEANAHAIALDPDNVAAIRVSICVRMLTCSWEERDEDKRRIGEGLRTGTRLIAPVFHRAIIESEAEHSLLTRLWTRGFPQFEPLWKGERYRHDRIRVAYISTDFRDHVVSDVIAGCLEHHDKTRFETIGFSIGPDDGSNMRKRLVSAFNRFIDARKMSDGDAAALLRELEIDIVVDLNGYSGEKRTGILARRPAPVQVSYLGYPGTMNAPFVDYIIADERVIPEQNQVHYSEKVVYLPNSFFPTDRSRPITETMPLRSDQGLPETGIVFACHNSPHKITPEVFDVWMRLLRSVDGSVLWLKSMSARTITNLKAEAQARGVAPDRLIFAARVPSNADHLARLRLADLFLDTRPYNAHATAADALWAGLPIVTCSGDSYPSRVAASLLHAIGLPELVTASLTEYEELARTLAQNPDRLGVLKTKLRHNRETTPLFDTLCFTRDLEAAFRTMWHRQQAGLPPDSFSVCR